MEEVSLRVLQINSVVGTGSTGRIMQMLSKKTIEQGHQSLLLYGRKSPSPPNNAIRVSNDLDNKLHGLGTRIFDKHGMYSKSSTRSMIGEIEKFNPDIVHLHNIHGYYLNMKIFFDYLKSAKFPVVWTLHDCWPYTGHCAYYDYVQCERWKVVCHTCPNKKEYPKSLLIDRSRKNYVQKKELFNSLEKLVFVTPSQWLANELQESFLANYSSYVINNGINLEPFHRAYSPTKKNLRKTILAVANRWEKRKGLEYVLDSAKKLTMFDFVIVGDLMGQSISSYPNVKHVQRTDSIETLASIYATADVFVNPTLEDNFPTTNIESLAAGTPVVTFNTGGSPEAIDILTGAIVNKGNTGELVKCLESINLLPEDCYNRSKKFSLEKFSAEYLDLYNKILGIFSL